MEQAQIISLLGWINKSYLVILSYTKDCAIGDGEYGE